MAKREYLSLIACTNGCGRLTANLRGKCTKCLYADMKKKAKERRRAASSREKPVCHIYLSRYKHHADD